MIEFEIDFSNTFDNLCCTFVKRSTGSNSSIILLETKHRNTHSVTIHHYIVTDFIRHRQNFLPSMKCSVCMAWLCKIALEVHDPTLIWLRESECPHCGVFWRLLKNAQPSFCNSKYCDFHLIWRFHGARHQQSHCKSPYHFKKRKEVTIVHWEYIYIYWRIWFIW